MLRVFWLSSFHIFDDVGKCSCKLVESVILIYELVCVIIVWISIKNDIN